MAGSIAERVGRELLKLSPEVLVENGGDIYLKNLKKRRVGIYTGTPPFDGRVALRSGPARPRWEYARLPGPWGIPSVLAAPMP